MKIHRWGLKLTGLLGTAGAGTDAGASSTADARSASIGGSR